MAVAAKPAGQALPEGTLTAAFIAPTITTFARCREGLVLSGSSLKAVACMLETLRCQDPWKREIILTDERWYGKILIDHPILTACLTQVQQTLTTPDVVNYDQTRLDVENFYRRVRLPAPVGWAYLKVCVRFNAASGHVLTAYPILRVKQTEMQKWP